MILKAPTRENVIKLSKHKQEPEWMLELRLRALEHFLKTPLPKWGPDLSKIDFDSLIYYADVTDRPWRSWDMVPDKIKEYFEKIGIPQAEREFLAGVGAQYDSSVIYKSLHKQLEEQGVIFLDTDTALKEHEDLFKQYFGKLVPYADNKFAALNTAFWSGGSFIYVPAGVKVTMPLHAFFRMQRPHAAQFERTLIIVEDGAQVEYLEGCTAPRNLTTTLHAAVVEIYVKPGAKVKYTTMQNWSADIYNLVTKRAQVQEDAIMQWVDVNVGSTVNMKYPSCLLVGKGAKGIIYSIAMAKNGQIQDTGTKMIHLAPKTKSIVVSKAISKRGGVNEYRGLIKIAKNAPDSNSHIVCDALIFGEKDAYAGTLPVNILENTSSKITHEASISALDNLKMFYLTSRGLEPLEAQVMVVSGFVDEIVKHLPLEFAQEFYHLIEFELREDEEVASR